MAKKPLRSLPIGAKFHWQDRYESGCTIDYCGVKLAEVDKIWDHVEITERMMMQPKMKIVWASTDLFRTRFDSYTQVNELE